MTLLLPRGRLLLASRSSLLRGLVAYWPLDEVSGTRADISGNGLFLTDNNTVTQAAGKIGSAAAFTAANNEFFTRGDHPLLSMGDLDFTVALWAYLTDKTADRVLIGKGDAGAAATLEYMIEYFNGTDRFRWRVGDGSSNSAIATANTLGSPATETWYFIVAWHDATANTINIQVNNGTVDSAAYSAGSHDNASGLWIGKEPNGGFGKMEGRIDEVAVWRRLLTAAERTALYAAGSGRRYPF